MVRARKDFTEEEIAILKTSPHVMDVSTCIVHFTAAFKSLFWQKFQSGMTPADIFRESVIDSDILGKTRVNGFKEMPKGEVKWGKGFRNLTTANEYYTKNVTAEQRIAYLGQHRTKHRRRTARLVLLCYNRTMDKQMSMSFFADELAEVKTHRKEFLEQMNRLIP